MKVALVTGAGGQDGSYALDLLKRKGYIVIALRHSASLLSQQDGDHLKSVYWDFRDLSIFEEIIRTEAPDEIYNFASYSSGSGMFSAPIEIADVNGVAVVRILEAVRKVNPSIRLCQASSSEMFGEASTSPQTEETEFSPRSPYGAAKLFAHQMIGIYRKRHGIFACSAILFNHESPRRGLDFVTRKIARGVAEIKAGRQRGLALGNLDARRDWGFARDYVEAMVEMLQQGQAEDYVIATGETHTVREFCKLAFERVGLDYREFVSEEAASFRPAEDVPLVGDASKALHQLAWSPTARFADLVAMMVDAEMDSIANGRS